MTTEERIAALEARIVELEAALAAEHQQVVENRARIEKNIENIAANQARLDKHKKKIQKNTDYLTKHHKGLMELMTEGAAAGMERYVSQMVEAGKPFHTEEELAAMRKEHEILDVMEKITEASIESRKVEIDNYLEIAAANKKEN